MPATAQEVPCTTRHAQGATPSRSLRLALIDVLAVPDLAAGPTVAGAAAPATKSPHRLAPPEVKPPKKPRKSARHKRRGPTARASVCNAPFVGDWRNINASTDAMTRALMTFTCSDIILCDTNGNCTGGDSYYSTPWSESARLAIAPGAAYGAYPQYDGWI
jgi:hypothetical protein